jgi:hypothetical protein
MGRHKRNVVAVGLIAVLAAFVPVAAAHKPRGKKKPKEMTFNVTLEIFGGSWQSHYDCKCNHDEYGGVHISDEHDSHLKFEATYDDVTIPMQGPWDRSAHQAASKWSATGSFSWDEDVWTPKNSDFPVSCSGSIEKGAEAPVLSRDRAGNESFHFVVQSGKEFKVAHLTGRNCSTDRDFKPFYPESINPFETDEVAMMFAADILGDRDELRHVKVGDVFGVTGGHDHWSRFTPPSRCNDLTGGRCTQYIDWRLHVRFQRTG